MKIVCFGVNRRGVDVLAHLLDKGFTVVGAVTEDKASCRPFRDLATARGIPSLAAQNINAPEALAALAAWQADVFVIISYNQILKPDALKLPRLGVYNLHGGRLPEYRGSSVLNWQIIRGEKNLGLSIIRVDPGIDSGDVVCQASFPLGPDETINEAQERSIALFKEMLTDLLAGIAAGREPVRTPQDPARARYFCKRRPEDGRIDWATMTDRDVHNLVRALTGPDCPGAFTALGDRKVTIWRTRLLEETVIATPGKIALRRHGGLVVMCADRGVLVTESTPPCGELLTATGAPFFR